MNSQFMERIEKQERICSEMPTDRCPAVFDAAQLNRAHEGSASLQVEVLSLFVAEVERLMRQVEDAPDPQLRGDRLRALIGVARNTGAALIAQRRGRSKRKSPPKTPI